MLQLVLHRDQGGGEFFAEHGVNGGGQLVVPRGVEHLFPLPDEPEGDLRVGQGHLVQHPRHGVALGGVFFQELHAGWGVVEQVPHHDGGAGRAAGLLQGVLLPAAAEIPGAGLGVLGPGEQLHMGHRGDGGQCLPPEAQGADGLQVVLPPDLAGGVAEEGGGHVLRGDAAAVVRHPHVGDASPADLHSDDGSPGVHGVFHQLFDDGRGPLHHFSRGDQFRHLFFQHLNARHSPASFPLISACCTARTGCSCTVWGSSCSRPGFAASAALPRRLSPWSAAPAPRRTGGAGDAGPRRRWLPAL